MMTENLNPADVLGKPLELPCGVILKNRLVKAPMSDSLGNGEGDPTATQIRLYERWAEGGAALSIIGEVQGDPRFPEKPGNLVLGLNTNQQALQSLSRRAMIDGAHLWPQLGHAGALSHLPISQPKGPSALSIGDFRCAGMSIDEVKKLPYLYAKTAGYAKAAGFSGIQIHAGHGFLLSQFLSPLFNLRSDGYGGSIEARCRIVIEVVAEVRRAVGPTFPIGIKINSTDKLEGGLTQDDALEVVRLLDQTSIDLIDISGGTYFPGAKASSDGSSRGPYFLDFTRRAKEVTNVPLMVTGGFKKREQAVNAVDSGAADMVGIARAMVLNPRLAEVWLTKDGGNPDFPKFESAPPGGITAWYTMRLTALGEDRENEFTLNLPSALRIYEERDAKRCIKWQKKF
ncbi:MAG: NADH:flavin oxidoreductase/NADH oxidase family protein [Desulfobacula sp.]|jgi:2,4-dienoyl-CoA reductase-like NADH-dependent reductase (Old Yellow Enzyme family)|nr:NADH:flavin oxidoreductase/NADH oxidase family protein [Desulfobacula sp.]